MWGIRRTCCSEARCMRREIYTRVATGCLAKNKKERVVDREKRRPSKRQKSHQGGLRNIDRPYCCVRSRSKCFLLSSAGFIRGGWAVATSHPSSLLPTQALRMFFNSLILSLVLSWASLRSAHAMPTSKMVVELSACGMTPETSSELLPQQVSIF